MVEFISLSEVGSKIPDNSSVVIEGFIGSGVAEAVHISVEEYFNLTNHPQNLTLIHAAGIGDGIDKGMNHYAHEKMVKRIIGGHWAMAPKLFPLVKENKIEAYNFPQGVISRMMRAASAHDPFVFTQIGLDTFVDPEYDGGKLNNLATEDLVFKENIHGNELLLYKTIFPNVAIIRGTYADENGNISFEEEPLTLEATSEAMAAKNNNGIVIVQVKDIVPAGYLDPKKVKLPKILVDYIVKTDTMEHHMQTYHTGYNSLFLKSSSKNLDVNKNNANVPLNNRKIIARRCTQFIDKTDKIVNYGIGMPETIAKVLCEENVGDALFPTIEPGTFGGSPLGGLDFGVSIKPESIIGQDQMFDFYNGGGIDIAFLGLAECDENGNINVSRFGNKIAGAGGFIDITQSTNKIIFCGTFTAGGLKTHVKDGKLFIDCEGKFHKFVKDVQHLTFNGQRAYKMHKSIFYVTERAVFQLTSDGLTLIEIAPGINLQSDIINQMEFIPKISDHLKLMDKKIFIDKKMDLQF